ncbi:MAG: T9SS type A sorting domain-containing protein [Bacteroidota bacterium]|nr:T9SS type A sorting domain-containing protein [Bacteroidota bacterium]
MKKYYSLLIAVLVTAAAMSQTTYTWQGANNASWAVSTNWTPTRTTPAANDILQFNDGSTKTVTAVPTQTVGTVVVTANTTVTLQAAAGVTLTIGNGAGTDFQVDAGSQLTMGTNVNVTIAANATASIDGTLTINAGRTYNTNNTGAIVTTVTGTIDNSGTITASGTKLTFSSGGTYNHTQNNGTVPTASWNAASNCNITGVTNGVPAGLNQAFGNFTWDCAGQGINQLQLPAAGMSIAGDFTINNTGTTGRLQTNQSPLTVGGDLSLNGSSTLRIGSNTARTLTVSGNVSVNGGTLLMSSGNANGTLNVAGNFSQSGGTITQAGGNGHGIIVFNGSSTQTFSKATAPTAVISNIIDVTINNGAIVDFGTSVLDGSTGTFTLSAGGKIITSNSNGLSATGTVQITAAYNSGADYEFQDVSTGVFTTAPTASTVRNLVINNTTGNVTLAQPLAVTGDLTLTSGALTTTSTNIVTINAGGTTSGSSFVDGPMAKIGNTAFTFPVGKVGAGLRTVGISAPTASSTIRAEFFRADPHTFSSSYAAGITQISGCEYWTLNRTAGTGTGRVILSWAANSSCSGAGYVGNMTVLRVARLSGTWQNDGNFSVTGTNTAGTLTANSTSTFAFTFALATSSDNNPLPVMFGEVKAYEQNHGVQIEWNNLTERDLINYNVERSSNGQDFTTISQQLPKSNRNDAQSYSAFDASPFAGTNFYRIKVLEISGKIIYSKILKVDIGGKQSGFTLYPNPATGGQVSVAFNVKQGQYTLKVVNSAGQEVYSQKIDHQGGSMTQAIQLPSSVKPGFYNMMISGDNYRESKMFVVQ